MPWALAVLLGVLTAYTGGGLTVVHASRLSHRGNVQSTAKDAQAQASTLPSTATFSAISDLAAVWLPQPDQWLLHSLRSIANLQRHPVALLCLVCTSHFSFLSFPYFETSQGSGLVLSDRNRCCGGADNINRATEGCTQLCAQIQTQPNLTRAFSVQVLVLQDAAADYAIWFFPQGLG